MTRVGIAGAALALGLLALAAGYRALERGVGSIAASRPPVVPAPPVGSPPAVAPTLATAADAGRGFLYGRVTAVDGSIYEGRLRWGRDEEAFWGDAFNGAKVGNPWAAYVPPGRLPRERRPISILGFEIARRERPIDLGRPFMARFGDLARLESRGRVVRVTLKSGTAFDLERFEASDFDDGVRVWDRARGLVDLESRRIERVELLPTARLDAAPGRLRGTVRTRQGDFTGFVQWDRRACEGDDELHGHSATGELDLRFDGLRSIARRSRDGAVVTLLDGREIALAGGREIGRDNRGVYVDDPRYGRVLVSWDAFERLDFDSGVAGDPGATGPAYDDFAPGRPLAGSVTTRAGLRFAGRLVFDLDESETTETLDAPSAGVDYLIPFDRVVAIVPAGGDGADPERASVTLASGERLWLERAGDLGERNAGLLVFVEGRERPEYVPWSDVGRVDFDRPPAK